MTRLWVIAVLTVIGVVACDRVPLTSPTGSAIQISIDKEVLPIGGTATVTAVVTESSGTPVHNGTMVTFQASIGRTDPVEAPTVNGKATVTFIAGSVSGAGVIHAFSGGARTGSGNSSANGASVRIGTAAADRISVRSEPTNVPITGGTVTIIAGLFDSSGNPISNTPLTFSTEFGSLSSNSATTDANGEARVSLTTNRTTTITVSAGSRTQAYTLVALNPPSVEIANCTSTPTVGVPVNCTVTTGASGNSTSSAPIQNVTINWGDGSGEIPLGAQTGAQVVSHTYGAPGPYTVVAAATDANGQRNTRTIVLNVTRILPAVNLSCPTTGMTVGVPATFTVAPPATAGPIPIANVTVDFGDGTSRNLGQLTGSQSFTKAFSSDGGFTVTATTTDTAGQRGTSTCAVIVSRANPPTVGITQTSETTVPAVRGGPAETFNVTATAASGLSIRSVTVTRQDGVVLYNAGSGGQFATSEVARGDILTAQATDSAGNSASTQIVVQ